MAAHKRHRQPLAIHSEINVTNLLDTAFTLLIALMLVAPQLTHGIKIDLPNVQTPTMTDEPTKTLIITIQKRQEGEESEHIYVKYKTEGIVNSIEDLTAKISAAKAEQPDLAVVVEGDENSSYGTFLRVVAAVKDAGVDNIGMPSDPIGPPRPPNR